MSGNFGRIIVADFEYEVRGGDLPNVLCMVAFELNEHLQLVRIHQMWREEFGKSPPFDTGPDTLFVAYSAWAEMQCFKVLGWKFPTHIFDQHTPISRPATSCLRTTTVKSGQRKERPYTACSEYGLEGGEVSTRKQSERP